MILNFKVISSNNYVYDIVSCLICLVIIVAKIRQNFVFRNFSIFAAMTNLQASIYHVTVSICRKMLCLP